MIERSPSTDVVTIRPAGQGDLPQVQALVGEAGLMTTGVAEQIDAFLVAEDAGRIVGAAGIEVYEEAALLRSVAVSPSSRGRGLGARLVRAALAEASRRGVRRVALLTENAGPFFHRMGFRDSVRERLDHRLLTSSQFTEPSCATALVMTLELETLRREAES